MSNYVEQLNGDDIYYLCTIIGGKQLRDIYKKNTKAFNKKRPGFRPGNLSDEETFNFASTYKDEDFVAYFFNHWLDDRLKEISNEIAMQTDKGMKEDLAVAETLVKSVFYKRPELYFRLTDSRPPIENADFFYQFINLAREQMASSSDESRSDNNQNLSKEALSELENEHKAKIDAINVEHENALREAKEEVKRLQNTINNLENETRSQREQNHALQKELEEYKQLSSFEIPSPEFTVRDEYLYASLCQTYIDDRGQSRLIRMADVKDGELSTIFLSDAPNYSLLYRKDGPDNEGFIGIWDWKTVPKRSDPTKDFIETEFNAEEQPIEVLIVKDCLTVYDLAMKLQAGYPRNFHSDRVVFAINNGSSYEGIYCDRESASIQMGRVTLKPDIVKLPIYRFNSSNLMKFKDITIMSKLGMGIPIKLIRIKDPIEIVQKLIVDRTTWPVMQQGGFTRNEYRRAKEFLTGLPTEELYDQICRTCDCTTEEAKEFVDDFIARADEFSSGNTLENSILAQVIRNDPALYASCLEEVGKDWEKANQEQVETAKAELLSIQQDEAESKKRFEDKEKEYSLLIQKIKESEQKIDAQKHLAEEVETLVMAKIERARKNAAEFIAENAFVHSEMNTTITREVPIVNNISKVEKFMDSEEMSTEDYDVNNNYEQVLQTLNNELLEAGVADSSVEGLSVILYSAYINRIPLLLAGPNGMDIACAFYAALKCMKPAVLTCEGDLNDFEIERCLSSSNDLVVVETPFQAEWRNAVIKMLSKRDRMYILVHPYAEDLCIEPKGLFNYCVPLLTEMCVDAFPTGQYVGGRCSKEYKPYVSQVKKGLYDKLFASMNIRSISKMNCQLLLSDLHDLSKKGGVDADYEMILYPMAYVLDETNTLEDYINETDQKPSASFRERLSRLIGDRE